MIETENINEDINENINENINEDSDEDSDNFVDEDSDENIKLENRPGKNFTVQKMGKCFVYKHEGFTYHKSKLNVKGTHMAMRCQWSRSKKREQCGGTARLFLDHKNINSNYIVSKNHHCHEANDKQAVIYNFKKKVVQKCYEEPKIFGKDHFDIASTKFPYASDIGYNDVESSCQRATKKTWPKNPKTIEEVLKTIEDHANLDLLKYYLKTVKYSTKTEEVCSIIFGRQELINKFEESQEVGQDGTFRTTPEPFKQERI